MVTPLFEKYPNISLYAYCANNPVIMIDPDGKKAIDSEDDGIPPPKNPNIRIVSDCMGNDNNPKVPIKKSQSTPATSSTPSQTSSSQSNNTGIPVYYQRGHK